MQWQRIQKPKMSSMLFVIWHPAAGRVAFFFFFECLFLKSEPGSDFLYEPINCNECGSFPGTTRVQSCHEGLWWGGNCPETHWTRSRSPALHQCRACADWKICQATDICVSVCACARAHKRSRSVRRLLTFPNSIYTWSPQRFHSATSRFHLRCRSHASRARSHLQNNQDQDEEEAQTVFVLFYTLPL